MKKVLYILLSVLISAGAFAQNETYSAEVKFNSIVVLQDFQGDVQVQSWEKQTIQITNENGIVLQVYKTDDKVFISPSSSEGNNEEKYIVYLPKTIKLDWFSTDANLTIKGEFAALKVENTKGKTNLDLQNVAPSVLAYTSN